MISAFGVEDSRVSKAREKPPRKVTVMQAHRTPSPDKSWIVISDGKAVPPWSAPHQRVMMDNAKPKRKQEYDYRVVHGKPPIPGIDKTPPSAGIATRKPFYRQPTVRRAAKGVGAAGLASAAAVYEHRRRS